MHLVKDKALSYLGFAWHENVVYILLWNLSNIYTLDERFVSPEEWTSEGTLAQSKWHC